MVKYELPVDALLSLDPVIKGMFFTFHFADRIGQLEQTAMATPPRDDDMLM